jgi:hypothetical protein
VILLVQSIALKAENFSEKEKAIIYTNAIKVLQNYQDVTNQIGATSISNVIKAKSASESFLELFVNRQVLLYNDLDPAHKLSPFYEAESYASNIILWYPDGITINLDISNARVSEIMKHGENIFSVNIEVRKTINGNYLNQSMNKNTEDITFKIAFVTINRTVSNFRIAGIRSVSSLNAPDLTQTLKEVNSESFNAEDQEKIHSQIKTVLKDYTNFLSLLGDPQEPADEKEFHKVSFLKLFPDTVTRVFNDINPVPQSSFVPVNDYLISFMADYPAGIKNISLNSDSAKFGNVIRSLDKSYTTYVYTDKFFSGNFKGKDIFREMFPLIVKISFNASGNTFTDFHITGIDKSSANFYNTSTTDTTEKKPEIIIRPVSRKGFFVSLTGSFGQTRINDGNISGLSLSRNMHEWSVSPDYGFTGALGLTYYLTDNAGIRTGLEFNGYITKFSLRGRFTDNTQSTDVNTDIFYKIIEADFDSLVSIRYLTIPLLAHYTSGKPGKTGFYTEGGLKISVPLNASYKNAGTYKYSGYYPSNPSVLQYLDLKELGFYDNENMNKTGKVDISPVCLSFYASAGINIPFGYYSSVSIGPEINLGLTDILSGKKVYYDMFGNSHGHLAAKIKSFGVRVCFAYKL